MRLSLLESELRTRIDEEIREEEERRARFERYARTFEALARRSSAPPPSPSSVPPPPPSMASGEYGSIGTPRVPFEFRSGEYSSLRSAPSSSSSFSFSSFPPLVREDVSLPTLTSTLAPPPSRQSSTVTIFLATLAMILMGSALFVSAAHRAELPKARAATTTATTSSANDDGPTTITEMPAAPVVVSPAPTLKPATLRSASARGGGARKLPATTDEAAAKADSAADGALSPAAAATPSPTLDQAARTAQMLRDQLGSSVR